MLLWQSTRPTQWSEWFEPEVVNPVHAPHGPRFEQFAMIAQAAASGLGAALLPRFLVESELASGALVVLSEQALIPIDAYYLVSPESGAQESLVQAFGDWVLIQATHQQGLGPALPGRDGNAVQQPEGSTKTIPKPAGLHFSRGSSPPMTRANLRGKVQRDKGPVPVTQVGSGTLGNPASAIANSLSS